jgi:glycosyltransferase involved in cell wall biosynthesis
METVADLEATETCYLSVIIPVFNEEENLIVLHQRLTAALSNLALTYEIIYVDDGSTDGSLKELITMADKDTNTMVIRFSRNFGQTAAMSAGVDHARGDVLVFLDADLQNQPEDIPAVLAKLDEGYDFVNGWRENRQDNWMWRKVPSYLANRLISYVIGLKLHDYGCTLKACRSRVLASTRLYGQMHRFIPAFVQIVGGKITEIPVNHAPRTRGKSKYGLKRTFNVILDLLTVKFLTTYSGSPIYLFGGAGLVLMAAGTVSGLSLIVHKFNYGTSFVQSPLLLLTTVLFLLGFQSILLGLAAELMTRTYYESQGKPTYVINQIIRKNRQG